jgi:hypothetical protein
LAFLDGVSATKEILGEILTVAAVFLRLLTSLVRPGRRHHHARSGGWWTSEGSIMTYLRTILAPAYFFGSNLNTWSLTPILIRCIVIFIVMPLS